MIRGARVFGATERAQELGAGRVIEVIAVQLFGEREELDVRLLGAANVPDRDRAIQSHDR